MQAQYATQSATLGVNADDVRTEDLLGREHVVAPATLVREMVLKGEFLPFEEIEATQLAWNAKPGTISHPTNQEGDFVPASHPDQIESHQAGQLFGVETTSTSRSLDGEIWIDRERSAAVADGLDRDDPAELLLEGETVEVSVGYWYQRFDADGEFEGDEFDAVQVGIQPDHLALLPNAEGECSIEDGCGAGRDDAAGAAMHAPLSALQRGAERLGLQFGAGCSECGGACDVHDDGEGSTANTGSGHDTPDGTMTDRIQNLAEQSAFDAETLSEWDDEQLDALEESLDVDDPDAGGDGGDGQTNSTDDQILQKLEDIEAQQQSLEERLEAQEGERREALVAQIQTHTSLEEEQLPEDVDALEALAAEVAPTGGVHVGARGAANADGDAGEDMPIGVGDRYLEEAE